MKYTKGAQVARGKTKTIWQDCDNPEMVIVENRDDITAHDDPTLTRQLPGKGEDATTTTCNVFRLLASCGLPVAFVEQVSPTEYRARKSDMLKLEMVGRRLAVGSYTMRHPELTPADPKKPHRFHRLETEFFLKTSGKKWGNLDLPVDDPLILNPEADTWQLAYPKIPLWATVGEGKDRKPLSPFAQVLASEVLPEGTTIACLDSLLRRVFLVLEKAWGVLGFTFVDLKIEGDDKSVSDVVDNDSWRLWKDGEPFDKQVFRDHGESAMEIIKRNYSYIARMSERLSLPKQALVLWRGSMGDTLPRIPLVPGVEIVDLVASGHKKTHQCLMAMEQLFSAYPQGGVIVTNVGRSNGLGPVLAAHSNWSVIAAPASLKEFPDDIWSSVRLPSETPLLTTWPAENAILAALRILGQTNPAAYAHTQVPLEELESYVA